MKRKILLISLFITIFCFGCSQEETSPEEVTVSAEKELSLEEKIIEEIAPVMENNIATTQKLQGGFITVPSYLQGEETKALSPVEESDNETTYELDGQQQTTLVQQTADQIQDSISEVLSDQTYYPHIIKISVNEDCSEFEVTFSSTELTIYETTLRMSLYLAGNKYQLYTGVPSDKLFTAVHYIDNITGEIFITGDSTELN